MSDSLSVVCFGKEDAWQACNRAYTLAQTLLLNGENALIECRAAAEPVGIQQRKFLHGPVLGQISEQASIDGQRLNVAGWKEVFKTLLIPPEWEQVRLPVLDPATHRLTIGPPVLRQKQISTEELGMRAYAKFIDEVVQYAAENLGVAFHFTNEEQALLRSKPGGRANRSEHE